MKQKLVSDIEEQLNEFARLNIKDCVRNNNFPTTQFISCIGLRGATVEDGKCKLYFELNSRIQGVLGGAERCVSSFDHRPKLAKPRQPLKVITKYLSECKINGTVDRALSQMKTELDQAARKRLRSRPDDELKDMLSNLQGVFSFERN